MINHIANAFSPCFPFAIAFVFGTASWIAQQIPEVPSWMSNSSLGLFFASLIYAVSTLWKRNQAMAREMADLTNRFHEEIREEMQSQIDAERASRGEQTKVTKELAGILKEIRADRAR